MQAIVSSLFQILPLFPICATKYILRLHFSVSLSDYAMVSNNNYMSKGKTPELTTLRSDKGNKKKVIEWLLLNVLDRESEGRMGKREKQRQRKRMLTTANLKLKQ